MVVGIGLLVIGLVKYQGSEIQMFTCYGALFWVMVATYTLLHVSLAKMNKKLSSILSELQKSKPGE